MEFEKVEEYEEAIIMAQVMIEECKRRLDASRERVRSLQEEMLKLKAKKT